MFTKKEAKELEQKEAKEHLRSLIKAGDVVYTILRHVSYSGMSRNIDVVTIKDGKPLFISWYVAKLLDYKQAKDGSLKVDGCGMDMGFHLVHLLGSALWLGEEWECTGKNCPYNEHNNDSKKYPRKAGLKHKGNGYTLNHQWL